MTAPRRGWASLTHHWGKDLQLWLYITLTLQLHRLLLIAVYHEQAGEQTGLSEVLTAMGMGLRFDISTAGAWVLPLFLLAIPASLLPHTRLLDGLRQFSAQLYAILIIFVFGINLVFFGIYGDQFNQMIFGAIHDDTVAIAVTVWKEYHPLLFLSLALPLAWGNRWLVRRWLNYTPTISLHIGQIRPLASKIGIGLLIFFSFTAAVRGGALWGQPIRLKHAFVVDDLFLNRTVLNPLTALRYTLQVRAQLERGAALSLFWPSQNIRSALDYELGLRGTGHIPSSGLDQSLQAVAAGHPGTRPRHIFLILLESHDGWTLMPEYRDAGLSPGLANIADQGIYYPNFLPTGSGTIGSMNTLITGMPDAGLNINYEINSQSPYPSGLAYQLRKLGYTTRFFYGGYLSWQRLDSFAQNQGFDELHGGGSMRAGLHTNEWGVDDQYLFDYVLEQVDDEIPSFNFILSTSNHPPYDLDLPAHGFTQTRLPERMRPSRNPEHTMRVYGHLWYTDKHTARFVHEAEQRLKAPLFAITADHTTRLQVGFPGDSVAEQVAVPFILYGKEVLPQPPGIDRTAGSHLDIPPTLIELAAEPGYRYPKYGNSMLHKSSPSYGYGKHFIIGEDYIADDNEQYRFYSLPGQEIPAEHPDLATEIKRYNALKALSWYRIRKGDALPE